MAAVAIDTPLSTSALAAVPVLLTWNARLDNETVKETTKSLASLAGFSYAAWRSDWSRRLALRAAGRGVEHRGTTATVKVTRGPVFPVSIDSDEAWDGLIDVVRDVGGAKGSSSPVRVELVADWVRKEVPAVRAASPPADLLGEDDTGEEEDEQEVAPPAKKARKSATTKALADLEEARKVEEAVGNSVAALLTQWECTKKGCPHHARGKGVCFVVNGLHYEVRFDDLGQWSKAIRQGHATVTVPPASLMLRMRRDGDPGPSPSLAAAPAAPATPHGHPTASSQCAHLPAACAHVPTPSWALAPPWPAAPWSAAPPLPPPPSLRAAA